MTLFDLSGRKAIVTGGSRGIGRSLALGLARAGAEICVVSRERNAATAAIVRDLHSLGRQQSFFVAGDVSNRQAIDAAIETITGRWGSVDILVNSAGMSQGVAAEDMSESDWDRIMNVNLKGLFFCTQAVARQMIAQRRGAIINVGSISGFIAPRPQACYNASKAAVHMLTKSLAVEWARFGIRVNCIAPGFIRTDMTLPSITNFPDKVAKYMIEPSVQKRIGEPDELAGAAIFLASDEAAFMTGAIITIDGGYTLV